MLYAHGPDLCHESDLKHAMANCLEALMGALFLDGGIDLADRVFGEVLFDDDEGLLHTWINLPRHPLQEDEPNGDRHWITSSPVLQVYILFLAHLVYQPKSLIQSCLVRHRPTSSLALTLASIYTSPWHRVSFIFGGHLHLCPLHMHVNNSDL